MFDDVITAPAAGAAGAASSAAGAVTPMGWLMAGSSVLSAALGGGSAPAGPSVLDAITDTRLDFSGWTVATGGSKADATSSKAEAGGFPVWAQLAIAGVLLIVAVKVLRK